jgi:hypothetical protein
MNGTDVSVIFFVSLSQKFSFILLFSTFSAKSDHERKHDELVQNIRFDIGIISYQQWREKLGNLKTILNIAPFTLTGDINDAIFPLLNEALQNPNLLHSLRQHYSIPAESDSSSEKEDTPSTNASPKVKQRNSTSDKSKTDERSSVVSRISNNSVKRNKKVHKFKEEKKWRRRIPEKPSAKSSFSDSEKLEFQSKFAELMQKNEDEFQKFCTDNEHSSQSLEKRHIQAYPTAIFGPSPFSEIKIQPCKRLPSCNKVDLPLKFPWNGVFDTKPPSITWTDPSLFFFFEVTSSEKH